MATDIDWKHARILIMDPNDQVRFQLRMSLNRLQPAKLMGTDAAGEALRLIAQYGAHVALVDMSSEMCAGFDFLQRVRNKLSSPSPELSVLLMLHPEDNIPLAKACALGFEGVLLKPITEQSLLSTVEQTIKSPCRMTPSSLGLETRPQQHQSFFSAPSAALGKDDLDLLAHVKQRETASTTPPRSPARPVVSATPLHKAEEGASAGKGGAGTVSLSLSLSLSPSPSPKSVGLETAAPPLPSKPAPKTVGLETAPPSQRPKAAPQPAGVESAPSPQPAKPAAPVPKPVAKPVAKPAAKPVGTPPAPQPAKPPPQPEAKPAVKPVPKPAGTPPPPIPAKPAAKPAAKKLLPLKVALSAQDQRIADIARRLVAHQEWVTSQGISGEKGEFIGVNLEGWDLEDAQLSQAVLRESRLADANLKGAHLAGADLRYADLSGVCLSGANLSVARLRHVDLRLANLEDASLRGVDLAGANLTGAQFGAADLSGALFLETCLDDADLSTVAGLTQAQLRKVSGNAGTRLPFGLRLPAKPEA